MVTVFVPSSPTAFSGYVLMGTRESVVGFAMDVEEAMRLLISGGVLSPKLDPKMLPPLGKRIAMPDAETAQGTKGGEKQSPREAV